MARKINSPEGRATSSPARDGGRRRCTFILTVFLGSIPAAVSAANAVGVHAENYDGAAWNPFLVGAGIGVLSWLTFYLADKPIGASSFYACIAGFIGQIIAPRHTASLDYYRKHPPRLDWTVLFVLCTILGGTLAAWTGGEWRNEWLHPMWVDRFGDSLAYRAVVAIVGGVLMGFGARLAGGCTSGHGISGTLQLNVGSWVAVMAMFAGGVVTAFLFYSVV